MLNVRKYSIVVAVLMVFALSTAVFAQTATPAATATAAAAGPVVVANQAVQNRTVVVQNVTSVGAGWIVIHADANGSPGADVGHAAVKAGANPNVSVTIDTTKATARLYAMLHVDAGVVNTYEFPGADIPVPNATVGFNVTNFASLAQPTATAAAVTTATRAATAAPAATATAVRAVTATATRAGPSTLPTTGGGSMAWMFALLGISALSLFAALGLNVARKSN